MTLAPRSARSKTSFSQKDSNSMDPAQLQAELSSYIKRSIGQQAWR